MVTIKEPPDPRGLTTRATTCRLAKGDLKGYQKANASGVKEWLLYPTKDLASKLNDAQLKAVEEQLAPLCLTVQEMKSRGGRNG